MKNEFWTSSSGKLIRWIIFLPVASIAAIASGGIVFLINLIQSYFSGDSSKWAYVGAAVFSQLALLYVAWYILPNLKKVILYILFGMRVVISVIWFIFPETSPLNLTLLIVQELMVLGSGFILIKKLTGDDAI